MKVEMGEDGFTVTSKALGLFCLSEKANFAAWWLVDDTIMRDCIPEGQDQPDRLHCTAQFFGKGGAEWTRDFEAAGELRETVVLDYLYVAEDKSAASVRLSAGQEQWYVGGSVPHVSYGKKGSLEWKDLGPWVAECEKRTEWVRVEEDPDSQYWFAFTFQGKRWTWTVMPQGYTESPSVYGQELAKNLEGFTAPGGSTLVQYVDDLLLCSHTHESCKQGTIAMLDFLAKNGHKASKEKLQLVPQRVKYLGHVLGMIGYCRPWIQDYAQRSQPLVDLTIGLGLTDRLTWTPEAEDALIDLKQALMSAPALGVPDYQKPFIQYVDEKKGFMTSVQTQFHGGRCKPVAYYSKHMDSVARALPPCLRAVAAAAEAMMASADLVQLHPLTLRVPHAVHTILTQARTSHLAPARSVHYQNVLLTLANVTVERCSALNPATLLPTGVDGEPHDCLQVIECVCRPRPDPTDIPLEGGNILLFDGSSLRLEDGSPATSYAVVRDGSLVDGGQLPRHWSAKAAELFALQQLCKLAEKQKVTIYTDSRYAFGVLQRVSSADGNGAVHGVMGKAYGDILELTDLIFLDLHIQEWPKPFMAWIMCLVTGWWQL
ncbi:uncharacterized protein [Paramormyrops kingsleyae]|uniref:uncharacterized protein n=1 Tax=Paramormyrops kingsleyae TaxID=1676925 RepID=UPI003B96E831